MEGLKNKGFFVVVVVQCVGNTFMFTQLTP